MKLGRDPEAETAYRQAGEQLQELVREFPAEVRFRAALGSLQHRLGCWLDYKGRFQEGESALR